jgi:hypothetical protein
MFPCKLNTVTSQLKMIIYLTSDESASEKSMFLKKCLFHIITLEQNKKHQCTVQGIPNSTTMWAVLL